MSHSSKLIEPEEGDLGTSHPQPVIQKHRWQTGCEGGLWSKGGGSLIGSITCGIWCYLHVESARIELTACSVRKNIYIRPTSLPFLVFFLEDPSSIWCHFLSTKRIYFLKYSRSAGLLIINSLSFYLEMFFCHLHLWVVFLLDVNSRLIGNFSSFILKLFHFLLVC